MLASILPRAKEQVKKILWSCCWQFLIWGIILILCFFPNFSLILKLCKFSSYKLDVSFGSTAQNRRNIAGRILTVRLTLYSLQPPPCPPLQWSFQQRKLVFLTWFIASVHECSYISFQMLARHLSNSPVNMCPVLPSNTLDDSLENMLS